MTLRRTEASRNSRDAREVTAYLLSCTRSGSCQASDGCDRPSHFQVLLDGSSGPQQAPVQRRTEACAGHLGNAVQALTAWARDHEVGGGYLTVLAIGPPGGDHPPSQAERGESATRGLVFSRIPLADGIPLAE